MRNVPMQFVFLLTLCTAALATSLNEYIFDFSEDLSDAELSQLAGKTADNAAHTCIGDIFTIYSDVQKFRKAIGVNCTEQPDPETCEKKQQETLLETYYSAQLLDAFGKPRADVFDGDTYWIGSFPECKNVKIPKEKEMEQIYCTSAFGNPIPQLNAIKPVIYVGMCLPTSCNLTGLQQVIGFISQARNITLPYPGGLECHPELSVTDDKKAVGMIVFLGIWGGLIFMCTAADLILRHLESKENGIQANFKSSTVVQIVKGCSLVSNGEKLLSGEKRAGSVDCIQGIRFLSMAWVILGHTYFYASFSDNDLLRLGNQLYKTAFLPLSNGTLSVDTFFVVSGFLLAYLWLKETEKKQKQNIKSPFHWIMFYVHRYLRLTPVYMVILAFVVTLYRFLSDGPLWPHYGFETKNCSEQWWSNVLYINNFVHTDESCMGHTWYLAVDMQLHVFSPILLVAFAYMRFYALIPAVAFILASDIGTGWYFYHNHSNPNQIPIPGTFNGGRGATASSNAFKDVYIKPYTRLGPYVVGIALGFLLSEKRFRNIKLNKLVNLVGWLVALTMICVCVYALDPVVTGGKTMPDGANWFYSGFVRTFFGASIGWIIFSCATGNGGYVNSILSYGGMFPLSRLTYCAYLIHPYVMLLRYLGMDRAAHFGSSYSFLYEYFGHLVFAYAIAFATSLLFESPTMAVEKMILRREKTEDQKQLIGEGESGDSSGSNSSILANGVEERGRLQRPGYY